MSFVSKFVGANKIGKASKRILWAAIILVAGIVGSVLLNKLL